MIKKFVMTGNEIDTGFLQPGVNDLNANELDSDGITEAYGKGYNPEIMLKADDSNADIIYVSENSNDPAENQYDMLPGKTLTLDYNQYVKTMNQFFLTGQLGDILTVIVR